MNPKVLLFDLETSPNLAYVWAKYQQDAIAFKEEWQLLSFSAKWLHGKTIFKGLNHYSEKELVKELWKLFDEADILVAHNGDKFDIKKANAKFLEFNLQPYSPVETVDTLKVLKSRFALTSNRLNDAGRKLGLGTKVQTGGFDLWLGCINKDKKAWRLMEKYNRQDVVLLEKIYLRILPWIKRHPHFIDGLKDCPNCNSTNLQKRGQGFNKLGKYQRVQCLDCGSWSQVKI